MFVLKTKNTGAYPNKYFVNPSFAGWDLTDDISKATRFNTEIEANEVCRAVDNAMYIIYRDNPSMASWATVIGYEIDIPCEMQKKVLMNVSYPSSTVKSNKELEVLLTDYLAEEGINTHHVEIYDITN